MDTILYLEGNQIYLDGPATKFSWDLESKLRREKATYQPLNKGKGRRFALPLAKNQVVRDILSEEKVSYYDDTVPLTINIRNNVISVMGHILNTPQGRRLEAVNQGLDYSNTEHGYIIPKYEIFNYIFWLEENGYSYEGNKSYLKGLGERR
jgi:hypothetical protein